MRLASGQLEQLTHGHAMRRARDGDLRLSVHPEHERVVRCGVLAETFAGIEGKRRHGARRFLDERTADHGIRLIRDQVKLGHHTSQLARIRRISGHLATSVQVDIPGCQECRSRQRFSPQTNSPSRDFLPVSLGGSVVVTRSKYRRSFVTARCGADSVVCRNCRSFSSSGLR
jgi:hypothetical protein